MIEPVLSGLSPSDTGEGEFAIFMAIKGTKNWKGRELKNGEESSKME
jgi:hypothetical protein